MKYYSAYALHSLSVWLLQLTDSFRAILSQATTATTMHHAMYTNTLQTATSQILVKFPIWQGTKQYPQCFVTTTTIGITYFETNRLLFRKCLKLSTMH